MLQLFCLGATLILAIRNRLFKKTDWNRYSSFGVNPVIDLQINNNRLHCKIEGKVLLRSITQVETVGDMLDLTENLYISYGGRRKTGPRLMTSLRIRVIEWVMVYIRKKKKTVWKRVMWFNGWLTQQEDMCRRFIPTRCPISVILYDIDLSYEVEYCYVVSLLKRGSNQWYERKISMTQKGTALYL